jgi:hypothetical protein
MGLLMGTDGRIVRVIRGGVAVLAAAALVAGCGTKTDQPGTSSTASKPGAVDVSALDVGNYPTKPQPALGAAGTPARSAITDAQRLADFVLGPWDVDPTLIGSYASTALVLKGADALRLIVPKDVAAAAGHQPFVNGFYSARQGTDKTILINAVLRYPDAGTAQAAATDMVQTALNEAASGATRSKVPVPGHPDTLTSSYPFTDPVVGKEQSTVLALTPHGTYVLLQLAQSYQGLDAAVGLVAKTLDAQAPLIDQFTPTAVADFAGLPLDPTGLLARTLLVPAKEASVVQNWVYAARGALHFQTDPVAAAKLFSDTGTDAVANGKTSVYKTSAPAAAGTLGAAFVKQVTATGAKPADPVKGLPASSCLQTADGGSYCTATAERYLIEVQGAQVRDVHQMLAAQSALLVAP